MVSNIWRPFQKEIQALQEAQGATSRKRKGNAKGLRRNYPERDQVHRPLIAWHWSIPILAKHMFHVPNGGKMSAAQGAMKRMLGLKSGVVDLFISYPSGKYHGYYIELKAPGRKLNNEAQRSFLLLMRSVGYAADWYDDWSKAREAIRDYLEGQDVNKTHL